MMTLNLSMLLAMMDVAGTRFMQAVGWLVIIGVPVLIIGIIAVMVFAGHSFKKYKPTEKTEETKKDDE